MVERREEMGAEDLQIDDQPRSTSQSRCPVAELVVTKSFFFFFLSINQTNKQSERHTHTHDGLEGKPQLGSIRLECNANEER